VIRHGRFKQAVGTDHLIAQQIVRRAAATLGLIVAGP